MSKDQPSRRDLHADITNQLITAIETDPSQPSLPWRRTGGALHLPINALTGKAYNGINILNLWVMAESSGYDAPIWGTYRQWTELGAQVRRGEKSCLVVFYKEFETDPDPGDADDTGKRRMARASYVFNASQVDGYVLPELPQSLGPVERIERADRFVAATHAMICHGGDRAFYAPATDRIQMPEQGLFGAAACWWTSSWAGCKPGGHTQLPPQAPTATKQGAADAGWCVAGPDHSQLVRSLRCI